MIPINHLLVVREAVLDAHPWVAAALLTAFQQAKAAYLRDRYAAQGTAATDQHLANLAAVIGEDADPLPYGTAANWPALALLMEFMVAQGLLPRPFDRRRVLAPAEA